MLLVKVKLKWTPTHVSKLIIFSPSAFDCYSFMLCDRILLIGWASQRDGERTIISGKCQITKTTDQNRGSALQVSIIWGQKSLIIKEKHCFANVNFKQPWTLSWMGYFEHNSLRTFQLEFNRNLLMSNSKMTDWNRSALQVSIILRTEVPDWKSVHPLYSKVYPVFL